MFFNPKGIEVFYVPFHNPLEVPPRFIFDIHNLSWGHHCDKEQLADLIKSAKRIYIIRRFALGDVMMLLPVIRQLKVEYGDKHITIGTVVDILNSGFLQEFNEGVVNSFVSVDSAKPSYDLGILLDGLSRVIFLKRLSSHGNNIYKNS